jgi:hypothetical protein
VAGCHEHGKEPSGFIKCGEFLDWLRNCSFSRITLLYGINWHNRESARGRE